MEFLEIENKLNSIKVKKQTCEELLSQRRKRNDEIKQEIETILKSQSILQQVAKEVQSKLSLKIDSIVNLGLATCFADEYHFKLEYVIARGKTEVEFNLYDIDENPVDPMNQNGGGLIDILVFCLRVAVYSISRTSNLMVFDEPFKYVSKGLREKTAELLHTLSEKLNIQIIEVTHVEELMENSDKQFVLKKINGVSELI